MQGKWRGTFGPYGWERIDYGRFIRLGPVPEVTVHRRANRPDGGIRMKRIECGLLASASDLVRSHAVRVDRVPKVHDVETAAFEIVLVDGLATEAA